MSIFNCHASAQFLVMEPLYQCRDHGGKPGLFLEMRLLAKAHLRFAPVPGAFSKTQRVGGFPQTLSSSANPTQ
jgi:hypothetical protein